MASVNLKKDSENTPVKGGTMTDLGMTMCWSVYMLAFGYTRQMFLQSFCNAPLSIDDQEDEFLSGVRVSGVITASDK